MKSISVSRLKTHLSAEIRNLKTTGGLVVMQRAVPVARLLPLASDEKPGLRYYSRATRKFRLLKAATKLQTDPLDLLLADRRKEST